MSRFPANALGSGIILALTLHCCRRAQAHPTTPILARVLVNSPLAETVLGTFSVCCSAMAGHGDALSDDEDGVDLDGADSDAIEEARTGLDLLLSSLGRHIQPPLPTPLDPDPPVPETPAEPSSPYSIRAGTPATAGVSDTVLVGTSTSKSSSSRKFKLKQQRLSFGKSLSSVPVSESVVTESTVRPSLDINVQELVDAIYADALEKYRTKWVEMFLWLVLTKNVRGLPAFKCSRYSKHAGVRGRCGRTGKGATDVQTQAFHKHAGTRKHKLALEKQEALLAAANLQLRINEHRAAVDAEKIRVVSLLNAVGVEVQRIPGISTDGAGVMMGSRAGLVVRLRERVPHLISCHCIAHRCGEALAAKEAAEALPVFDMVDDLVRVTADLLGRSALKHQRFMDLQQLFTKTSLEVQGIHQVRWLSQGEAILRILAVWPAVVIFLKDYHSAMYLLATSYSRYVDCGDDFGGGSSRWLSPFIERYGPGKKRDITMDGVDSDGRPEKITFTLHDNPVDGYDGPKDHDGCIDLCINFAERIVANLERRLGDLDSLSGVRLFMPDEWPKGKPERHA
ncbi:unnamed protein product [Closterium sp. NIES-54]